MGEEKIVVEIKGVKMEIDTRYAKRVDRFRVGDKVKVLVPSGYSNEKHKVRPGVIVSFDQFEKLPTIVICYLETEYGDNGLKFVNFNAASEDVEIVAASDDYLPIEKGHVLEKMEKQIMEYHAKIQDLEQKKAYFLKRFGIYFDELEEASSVLEEAGKEEQCPIVNTR